MRWCALHVKGLLRWQPEADLPSLNSVSNRSLKLHSAAEQAWGAKVKQRVQLHEVVLHRSAGDNDAHAARELHQGPVTLGAAVLDLVALVQNKDIPERCGFVLVVKLWEPWLPVRSGEGQQFTLFN
jgi:hypothetical protein